MGKFKKLSGSKQANHLISDSKKSGVKKTTPPRRKKQGII